MTSYKELGFDGYVEKSAVQSDNLNQSLSDTSPGGFGGGIAFAEGLADNSIPFTALTIDRLLINQSVRGGADGYDDGTGFWLGHDGDDYKFFIGDSSADKMTWDGSTLAITGTITADAGSIGGFDIGTDYIRDAANSMGLASTVTGGDDVRFWAGDTFANRATAPFRVTEAGVITATSGTIGGFTLSATTLSATNLTLTSGAANTAHIAVGTAGNTAGMNSGNAAGDIAIWAGDTHANRATAPFRVEMDGSVTATDINITTNVQYQGVTSGITGAELETLSDGSDAGALHHHEIKHGTDSWNVAANGATKTITHNLGRAPKLITIYYGPANITSGPGLGVGIYDGSTYANVFKTGANDYSNASDTIIEVFTAGAIDWDATITTNGNNSFTMTSANYANTRNTVFAWRVE